MVLSDNLEEEGQIISVALPRPLNHLFTYRLPARFAGLTRVGGWVKIPFGKSVTRGFVVEQPRRLSEIPSGLRIEQLREVLEVGDPDSVLPEDVMALCRFAHEYYCV